MQIEKERKTYIRSFSMRPSTKTLLDKLSVLYDRTPASTIEAIIIETAKRRKIP